jgi:hypothetical protein
MRFSASTGARRGVVDWYPVDQAGRRRLLAPELLQEAPQAVGKLVVHVPVLFVEGWIDGRGGKRRQLTSGELDRVDVSGVEGVLDGNFVGVHAGAYPSFAREWRPERGGSK